MRALRPDRRAGVNQSCAVGIREADRAQRVEVAVTRGTGPPVVGRARVARIFRARPVGEALLSGCGESSNETGEVVTERGLRREHERGDAERVRRGHRRPLQPAEAGALGLEAGEVEQRSLELVAADEAVLGERAERAPAAVEDVAVAAVPAREVESAGAPGGGEGDGRGRTRGGGEPVAGAPLAAEG